MSRQCLGIAGPALAAAVLCAGNQLRADGKIIDAQTRTACGPIACFVALQSLGIEASLDDLVHKCDWSEGRSTTLMTMKTTLESYPEIRCFPVRLSPKELTEQVSNGAVAILAVHSNGSETINHSVCVVRAVRRQYLMVDYPRLDRWISADRLADAWDGEALVVAKGPGGAQWSAFLYGVLPGAVAGVPLGLWLMRQRKPGGLAASQSAQSPPPNPSRELESGAVS